MQFLTNCWKKLVLIYQSFSPKKAIVNPDYIFYEKHKKYFTDSVSYKNDFKNDNIDSCFYSKDAFQKVMKDENNFIEREWRTRILMQSTPRGNIIMYYDAYKQAFSYYSDSKCIPYYILNAVAMKYVVKFRCIDFFVDNQITQEISREKFKDVLTLENLTVYDSILIPIYFNEDKQENNKQSNKKQVLHNHSGIPYAKFKNYNSKILQNNVDTMIASKSNNSFIKIFNNIYRKLHFYWGELYKKIFSIGKLEKKEYLAYDKEYNFNKFIHSGKLSNFQVLQKPSQSNKNNGFKSQLLDDVCAESAVQNEVFSYSSYKKFIQNQQS